MAETLGMLCDKLTVVKLKEYHTNDENKLASLKNQAILLIEEIDEYLKDAVKGFIPVQKLRFESNKVYNHQIIEARNFEGSIGEIAGQLAAINCELWHEQEKVFEFEKVPVPQKDHVIKRLAILNLERNKCIDSINYILYKIIKQKNED